MFNDRLIYPYEYSESPNKLDIYYFSNFNISHKLIITTLYNHFIFHKY